ncbi:hypothetical protein N7532_008202 [Penicillium argentinense]|uniref:HMG box domain-containing protein n=1 Tax=Penicillium argentinense TaxID=1131581 RepID=A0A9W9K1D9_9EURO|nr:uncharacterized protein N7532_008202 [Penicillium argentinense]KAJ5089518.1 hypothetical protein N7532_008202 [Penicillium argentinense]
MTIIKLAGGLPPSPPNSSEGEFSPELPLDGRISYPAVPPPGYTFTNSGMEHPRMMGDFTPGTPPQQMVSSEPQTVYLSAIEGDSPDKYQMYGTPPTYYSSLPTSHPVSSRCATRTPNAMLRDTETQQPILPAHQSTTPSMMPIDIPGRVHSASPSSYNTSPSQKATPKGKPRAGRTSTQRRSRSHRTSVSGTKVKINLPGPLSEITRDFLVPVRDMEAYVHRPTAVRLEEATQRKAGEKKPIARPMNAFILYRSAYSARCKAYLGMENHQEVSRAMGNSWHKEPKHIKDQFSEWARVERTNHAIAFPGYKFQPKKDNLGARRSELTPPRSVSGLGETGSPPEWDAESDFAIAPQPVHRRTQSYEVSSRASTPFDGDSVLASSFPGSWNTSFTSNGSLSTIQPGMLSTMTNHVEDLHFQHGSPAPGMKYDFDAKYDYDSSSGLTGLPGGSHDDLLEPQSLHHVTTHFDNEHMDPQLLQYHQGPTMSADPNHLSQVGGYPPVWPNGDSGHYLPTSMASSHSSPAVYPAMDPHFMQRENSWDFMDPPTSSI